MAAAPPHLRFVIDLRLGRKGSRKPEVPPMPAPDLMPFALPQDGTPVRSPLPLHGVTLLVVEDSRFASEALRLMCQRSGARMRRADSLAAARRHLAVYRPDAVIVDLGLPDGDGSDLIREIAAPPGFGPAVLASSGDPALRGAALAAGATGFLDKPVEDVAAFQAEILRLFPGAPMAPAAGAGDAPLTDLIALTDDLAHVAERLSHEPGQEERRYLAGFLRSLARSARDAGLAQAAGQIALSGASLPEIAAAIRDRISAAPAPFARG
jgi:CheY-like chemotaxis protein